MAMVRGALSLGASDDPRRLQGVGTLGSDEFGHSEGLSKECAVKAFCVAKEHWETVACAR